MDERFHTPRQSANSSRSQSSSYGTPRNDLHSNRSISSSDSESIYQTPRSSYKSPADSTVSGNRLRGRLWGSGGHDRSRDFRRFSNRNPHRSASASIPRSHVSTDGHQDYDLAENGSFRKREPNFNVFSLARHGRVGELEELLLRGVPIDTADENGNTILHIGCQNGKKKIVKMALKYGAAVNAQNSVGNTALHFCTKYGFGDTLGRYLISKGADPSLRNNEDRLCTEVV